MTATSHVGGLTDRKVVEYSLVALAGREPDRGGGQLGVSWRVAGSRELGQLRHPAARHAAIVETILSLGARTDVYVTRAPRMAHSRIDRVWTLWAECDTAESIDAMRAFPLPPSLVVAVGGRRDAYWALREPVAPEPAEELMEQLAEVLGADRTSADPTTLCRLPGTTYWDGAMPRRVVLEDLHYSGPLPHAGDLSAALGVLG